MLNNTKVRKLFFGHSFLLFVPATVFHSQALPLPNSWSSSEMVSTRPADTTVTEAPDSSSLKTKTITIGLNKHVSGFVKKYVKEEKEFLDLMQERSQPYFKIIEKVFSKYDMPLQLKYLAIVESKLQQKATSKAGARGLWQLMPVTAIQLGLKINSKTDERLYTYKSTVAAAKYLKDLYGEYGDWLLVLAAYNSGPGTVNKAIKKAGSKNYWALQRFLPAESRGHVKRLIGVHYIFENEGSNTTLTKAEAKAWEEKVAEQLVVQN
jgi:membrane-bound lytic murein transglycosylase D